jgi:hypothetical protein
MNNLAPFCAADVNSPPLGGSAVYNKTCGGGSEQLETVLGWEDKHRGSSQKVIWAFTSERNLGGASRTRKAEPLPNVR